MERTPLKVTDRIFENQEGYDLRTPTEAVLKLLFPGEGRAPTVDELTIATVALENATVLLFARNAQSLPGFVTGIEMFVDQLLKVTKLVLLDNKPA